MLAIAPDELIVDNFAGGGGTSEGIEEALGRPADIAINHDRDAVAMHQVNHPRTRHLCEDVWDVDILAVTEGRPVGLAWFSPDCKHFSKALGGKPRSKKIRGLAWVVLKWGRLKKPRVIVLENVEEFATWGPLRNGRPCPKQRGRTFKRWVSSLQNLGYAVEWRELRACDYGSPTIRKRLVVIARCDGLPIVWPAATHGKGLLPYRTAAECIDWSLSCPSIFLTRKQARKIGVKRPLAEATMRRIARGVKRYVLDAAEPFVVNLTHQGGGRDQSVGEPMRTVTGARRGEKALVMPFVAPIAHYNGQDVAQPIGEGLRTITASPKGGSFALVAPTLVQTGYGERDGQAPRVPGLGKPLGTVVAGGSKHAVVAAFLAQHNGGMVGHDARKPLSTITARATNQQIVAANVVKLRGTNVGHGNDEPLHTISAGGTHLGQVWAFLTKYYGTDQDPRLADPMHTVTSKHRLALVTVRGEQYAIVDIGMRMLTPRELFRAQGFRDGYNIECNGLSKTAQIKLCGNSVCPQMAKAVVRAQFEVEREEIAA